MPFLPFFLKNLEGTCPFKVFCFKRGMVMNDEQYMKLALELAKTTTGQTSPNPMVGAVVVKKGEVVGVGAHLKSGTAHAEVHALQMAGENAKGATLYVTLEPCSHYGKTPPCADLIIAKKIKKVVIATADPNPQVAGRGIEKLRKAGIEVKVGLLAEEAAELNKFFFHFMKTKRPYVTIKTAMTLDGKIATTTGDSQWITGEEARKDVHYDRHKHDAILVGVGTVVADNPRLTTRLPNGGKNPIRIILDSKLKTPLESNVTNVQEAPTWIFTTNEADEKKKEQLLERGVRVFVLQQLEIKEVLKTLGKENVMSVYVEGGATVNGSLLKERAFNQLITYISPKLVGGEMAPTSFGGDGIKKLTEAVRLQIRSVEKVGDDIKVIAEVQEEEDVYRNH